MKSALTTTASSTEIAPLATPDLNEVIKAFSSEQDVKASSRQLYARTIAIFFDWVRSTGRAVEALSLADLIAYKDDLLASGKSSLTTASYINSLRRFYAWAEAYKLYPNIAAGLHAPKRRQNFRKQPLSVGKVGELLNHERTQSARDCAIVTLMLYTGLRCIEVVRADVGDITYKGGQRVLLVQGKGRDEKDNFVILSDAAYQPIAAYLNTRRGLKESAPLFASASHNNAGGRLTTRAVSMIAKAGLKSVGLADRAFTAHSLRHTAAVNILRAGGSLEQAQHTLRHSNPATTQIYTATLEEERRLTTGGEFLLDRLYRAI